MLHSEIGGVTVGLSAGVADEIDMDEVDRQLRAGNSLPKIAARLQIPESTLRYRIRRAGLELVAFWGLRPMTFADEGPQA